MRKFLMASAALALAGATPVFAQSAGSTNAPPNTSNGATNAGGVLPSSNGADNGEKGNAGGSSVETPTAPQEQQDLRDNPNQVPPSQRVAPGNPASPSIKGSGQ